ncbi:unnamed protein product, partial [Symbiodinium sp. CCMP2592]
MEGRRLEWSRRLQGGPGSWSLIDSDGAAFTTEAAPRWHLLFFSTDYVERLRCRFVQWHPADAQVAVFEAEELDYDTWISYPAGKVYVREVPSPLVVTCSLTPVPQNAVDMVFTTVAGEELLRIAGMSNPLPELEELATSAALAAAAQGRLRSRNQAVRTTLDGKESFVSHNLCRAPAAKEHREAIMQPESSRRWADMTDDDDQATGWEFEAFKKDYLARRCSLTLLTPVHAPGGTIKIDEARCLENLPDNRTSTGHDPALRREAKNTPTEEGITAPKKPLPRQPRGTADDERALDRAFQRAEAPERSYTPKAHNTSPGKRLVPLCAQADRAAEATPPRNEAVEAAKLARNAAEPSHEGPAARRGGAETDSDHDTEPGPSVEEHFRGMLAIKKMSGDGNCLFHESQYLQSDPGHWGGDTAIIAFTRMRQQRVLLHWRTPNGDILTSERTHSDVDEAAQRGPHAAPNATEVIHLWYNGRDHYDLL